MVTGWVALPPIRSQSEGFHASCRFELTVPRLLLDDCEAWTLNASLTRLSSYRKCSKRRILGHSAQATSLLPIEGTMKCSRRARGSVFGNSSGFAAAPENVTAHITILSVATGERERHCVEVHWCRHAGHAGLTPREPSLNGFRPIFGSKSEAWSSFSFTIRQTCNADVLRVVQTRRQLVSGRQVSLLRSGLAFLPAQDRRQRKDRVGSGTS